MKYSLVILTLNEIEGLEAIFPQIDLGSVDEVFAVDGGSTDGTLDFYEKNGVRVVKQTSRGRGEAFKIALKEAKGDVLIFFSPDGNEDPGDIAKFKPYFEKGCDMVIASRMMEGAFNEENVQIIKLRKWANNFFNFLSNFFFRKEGEYVTDSINGFRAISKDAFSKMRIEGKGFTIEYQITMQAFKKRLRIIEFPTREGARIGGEVKAKSIPTGIAFIKTFIKELFSRD